MSVDEKKTIATIHCIRKCLVHFVVTFLVSIASKVKSDRRKMIFVEKNGRIFFLEIYVI